MVVYIGKVIKFTDNYRQAYSRAMTDEPQYLYIPGYLPVRKVAEALGISDDRVLQHIHSKRLASKKVGGRYMVPEKAVEDFKHQPPGRSRKKAPGWHVFNSRIHLLALEIHVNVYAGQQERFEEKLHAVCQNQQHTFTGSVERFIFKNEASPEKVMIILLWKSNEMPKEAVRQQELDAFKADFANMLDWEHAEYRSNQGLLYT
jgi:excisionase family DNA binding protein